MAGLHKDKRTGIYVVQFYDPARTPKRKQATTGSRELRVAKRLHRRWEGAYAEGRYDPWSDPTLLLDDDARKRVVRSTVTLAEARERFLTSRAHRALNTRLNYERVTRWFVEHAGPSSPVHGVTSAVVARWLGSTDVKPVTKKNYAQHLGTYFRYCIDAGWLAQDPMPGVGLERVPRTFPKAMTEPDAARLVAAARSLPRSGWWLGPLVQTALWTALRRGELTHLRWQDIDFGAQRLTVACADGFTSKSGADRAVPLSDGACELLSDHRHESRTRLDDPFFVFEHGRGQVALSTLTHAVTRAAEAAGVQATVHGLRHTAITRLVERGVPLPVVQRVAGHGDIAVTMRYVHIGADVYADAVRRAFDG